MRATRTSGSKPSSHDTRPLCGPWPRLAEPGCREAVTAAGCSPASAVVADIVDVVRTLSADPSSRVPHLAFQADALSSVPVLPQSHGEGDAEPVRGRRVRGGVCKLLLAHHRASEQHAGAHVDGDARDDRDEEQEDARRQKEEPF